MIAINAYIDTMHLESDATMEYLKQYKEYIKELISAIQNRTIRNSNGGRTGAHDRRSHHPRRALVR